MFCTGVSGWTTTGPPTSWWTGGAALPGSFRIFDLNHKISPVASRFNVEVCRHYFRYDIASGFASTGYYFS